MSTLQASAIAFALSQLVLSGVLLVRANRWSMQRILFGLLLLAILGYLTGPIATESPWIHLASIAMDALPGMFFLFSASLFDDHFKLKQWQLTIVGATVVLPLIGRSIGDAGLFFHTLPQTLELVVLGMALIVVAQHWRIDLIESRRRLRLWFCGINGLYIFVLIVFREILFPDAVWLDTLQYLPVGLLLLATNAILLDFSGAVLDQPRSRAQAKPTETGAAAAAKTGDAPMPGEADHVLAQQLHALVEGEQVYREMSLTISQLANRLELPEYRLRRTINSGLGYRNFNDYLNSFRILEASRRLADPEQKDLPVLTIALDTGFRSLSSFNRAFKATYDRTPTAYRKEQLAKA